MDINLNDEYYKKYIKYKTKYLELKESEGGVFGIGKSNYGNSLELVKYIVDKKYEIKFKTDEEQFNYLQDQLFNILSTLYYINKKNVDNMSTNEILFKRHITYVYDTLLQIKMYLLIFIFNNYNDDYRNIINKKINFLKMIIEDKTSMFYLKNYKKLKDILKLYITKLNLLLLNKKLDYNNYINLIINDNDKPILFFDFNATKKNLIDDINVTRQFNNNRTLKNDNEQLDKIMNKLDEFGRLFYHLILYNDTQKKGEINSNNIILINNYITTVKLFIEYIIKNSKQNEILFDNKSNVTSANLVTNYNINKMINIILYKIKNKETDIEFNGIRYKIPNNIVKLLNDLYKYIENYIPKYIDEIKDIKKIFEKI